MVEIMDLNIGSHVAYWLQLKDFSALQYRCTPVYCLSKVPLLFRPIPDTYRFLSNFLAGSQVLCLWPPQATHGEEN